MATKPFNKKLLTKGLIAFSLVLLGIFQALWLGQVYKDQEQMLVKETDNLFRQTLITLQDSLIQRNIRPLGDSLPRQVQFYSRMVDSVRVMPAPPPDWGNGESKDRFIQIIVSDKDPQDSLSLDRIGPMIADIQRGSPRKGNFSIRLNQDTLIASEIEKQYAQVLSKAGIDVPFEVTWLNPFEAYPEAEGTFTTHKLRGFPGAPGHIAIFSGYKPFLLSKMVPQALFSLFFTLVTCSAFWLIYRNLRKQEQLARLKNDFISNITHELKTPIATVSVAMEALMNFDVLQRPQQAREYLEISKNELSRLNMLVDKVMKISLFEHAGLVLEPRTTDLKTLTEKVLHSMKLQLEKHKARLHFQAEGNDFQLVGDETHLMHVVYNLLDNALKYSDDTPEISLMLSGHEGQPLILSVQDKGIGIPENYQEKIFQKFFRVPTGNVHNTKGYGLGLNYVASVVKSHGGHIRLESTQGQGSTFAITLPRAFSPQNPALKTPKMAST